MRPSSQDKHLQAFKSLGGEIFNELNHHRWSRALGSHAKRHGMSLAWARDPLVPKCIGGL